MAKEIDAPFDAHTTEYVTTMNSIECLHVIVLNDTVSNYDTFSTSLHMVTPRSRAPKILLGRTNYSAAIDMWAVGCVFAEMVKGKCLFDGSGSATIEYDILSGIFSYFGMPDANTLPEVTSLSDSDRSLLTPTVTVNLVKELIKLDPGGLELLFRMLSLNPTTRITAKNALNHPCFKDSHGSLSSPRYEAFGFP